MDTAILILALAGILAVLLRAGAALLLVLRGGAEGMLARDIADTRARRGDLTGLQEATEAAGGARRTRWRGMGVFFMWAGLLIVPQLTPWPQLLYALYSLLWLMPRRPPIRRAA